MTVTVLITVRVARVPGLGRPGELDLLLPAALPGQVGDLAVHAIDSGTAAARIGVEVEFDVKEIPAIGGVVNPLKQQ